MPRPFAFPGTRARYAPDRAFDVEHYRIEIELHLAERRITGRCAITLAPIADAVRTISLDAIELEIAGVVRDGRDLPFSYDGHKLRIELPAPLAAGERTTIVVAYTGAPRRGLYFVGPDAGYPKRRPQVWTQGQDEDSRHWFPCVDAPNEKSTSEVIATVPANFYALSNGDLIEVIDDPGRGIKRYHWQLDVPHSCYLVTLAAGELVQLTDHWQDVAVSYHVEPGREDDARRALGRTPEMLECFSQRFGLPYPYRKYAQVCVSEFIFGGMENTTATTLTDNILFDERAALDHDMEALVAHELAHQWFGDLVTCRDWGQGWLNEGFATYSEYIWREWGHNADEAHMELLDWADQYFGEDTKRYRRPIATNVYDEPIDVFDHHLYEKGGLVLHMLRGLLGEGPFWKALGHYLKKHQSGSVETRDLVRAIEEATGRSVDWFFEQWVERAGHPELKVEYDWQAERKLARFAVKQTQKVEGDTPLFRLPMRVRFRVLDRDVILPLEVTDSNEVFFFPLEAEPTQAIFDTGQPTLKEIKVQKPRSLWLAELAGATEAADRIAAAKELGQQTATEVVAALERAMRGDRFWGVRAAAAEALGRHRSPNARAALVRALDIKLPHKSRRAVVKALGELRGDDEAAAALETIVRSGDASYFVEAEACLALGRTRSPRAPEALRLALARDSHLDVIRQHAYKGLAEARDASALPILLDGTQYGKVSQGRRAAIHALANLVEGHNDAAGRLVRERLEELLADPDFRVEQAALEALHTLGDPKALPALRRAIELNLDGRIRRRGREIVRELEEGRSASEATKTLRDEVDRLRQELLGLRERLAKLESPPTAVASPAGIKAKGAGRAPKAKNRPPIASSRAAKSAPLLRKRSPAFPKARPRR